MGGEPGAGRSTWGLESGSGERGILNTECGMDRVRIDMAAMEGRAASGE